ncbi:UbiA family prenyltransferase [Flavihumibacter sp. ZG627]|uniref:UbiA family prenyltransferase n=1 Tax=Flavihumibacter sp. ZG627 TaxID=1463156 RepID=UPI00057DC4B0|nr:UbiA family prenyltransferase [Flavihumibacter sp. ZG627]KIC91450.1 hypothetical protein HY58_04175 [Flavihumibacter sp. ZG627]
MKKLVDFLLFGAIFIAVCAVALCMETNWLLGIPLNHWSFYLLVFGATLVQYNLHYFFKQPTGFTSARDEWSIRNRTTQKALLVTGAICIVTSLWWLQTRHFGVLIVLALIASLYSLPLLPFGKRRLKEYGYLKIFLLTLEWTLVTVWFPVDQLAQDPTSYWLVFSRRFIFMFILCLLFDIRDMNSDRAANIKTLPVQLGLRRTYLLANISLLAFVLLSAWQLIRQGEFVFFHAMLLSAACTWVMITQTKKLNNDYVYLAGVDGMMLLQAILVGIGTI